MKMKTEPTAGAVRAAEKIADLIRINGCRNPAIATIIDEQTGLKELVKAAEDALLIMERRIHASPDSPVGKARIQLRSALAKAGK